MNYADEFDSLSNSQPQPTNNPGNIRPVGASVGFQHYDTPQDGLNAIDSNLQAYQKKGVVTLSGIINRWSPPNENKTSQLVANASKFTGLDPNQPLDVTNNPQHLQLVRNAILKQEGGSIQKTQVNKPFSYADEFNALGDSPATNNSAAPAQVKPSAPATAQNSNQDIKNKSLAVVDNSDNNNSSTFLKGAASLLDNVYNIIPTAEGTLTYAVQRALGKSPQDATGASKDVTDALSNPIGKAFGIDKDAAYTNEGSRQIMNKVGETVAPTLDKAKQYVASKTGIDPSDIGNIGQAASFALPKVISGANEVVSKLNRYRDVPLPEVYNSPTGKAGSIAATDPAPAATATAAERPIQGAGAATVNYNSHIPLTGEEDVRGGFPVVKLSTIGKDVSDPEQALRSYYVNEVMGDKNSVRTGVITGNENTLRNEHTEASAANPSPTGQALKTQIADEQNALSDYAQSRVDATGANPNLIKNETRGAAVNSTFFDGDNSLNKYYSDAKQSIFNYAKKTVGDNPIETNNIDSHTNNLQIAAQAEASDSDKILNAGKRLINLAKTVGFEDPVTGEVHPAGSISALYAVTKSMNEAWSPEKARAIGAFNGAIFKDIAASGGDGLYELGNKIHQSEKLTMGSKGIKSIFGPDDENGVTKGLPHEKILDSLNNLPMDQWSHIHNVLDNLSNGRIANAPEGMPAIPQELMQSAKAAKAEIEGSLAREVHHAGGSNVGVWNQNSVNKTLNSNVGEKILKTFPPEEIKNFHTLNYAGQIMPGKHSYEGGAQQLKRMGDIGLLEKYAPAIGAELMGKIPLPGTSAFGAYLGGKLSKKTEISRHNNLAKQMNEQMQANANLKNKR